MISTAANAESKLQARNMPLNKSNMQNIDWDSLSRDMRNNDDCDYSDYSDFPHTCGINQNSLINAVNEKLNYE